MAARVENSTTAPALGWRAVSPVTALSQAYKRLFFKLFFPAQDLSKLSKALIWRALPGPSGGLPTKLSTAEVDCWPGARQAQCRWAPPRRAGTAPRLGP